jgi:predicted nucleic acid-binding protein
MGGTVYVLDASAVIAFIANERGAQKVNQIFETPGRELMISRINWSEIIQILTRSVGHTEAVEILDAFMILTDTVVVETDRENSLLATTMRTEHRLSFADSYAASAASIHDGNLVAADSDFKSIGKIVKVIQIR